MSPKEHFELGEYYANRADGETRYNDATAQVSATLALAHFTAALARPEVGVVQYFTNVETTSD